NVRPGVTGWAQVNGRNSLTWEDKFRYDIEYVNTVSFWLDLKIVFITIKKVFKRQDISDFSDKNKEIDFDEYRRMEKK
ncbi:UDP-galactose phosphate transferase, partial [Fusobacterium nucleatum]